jgi:hypothetical protein
MRCIRSLTLAAIAVLSVGTAVAQTSLSESDQAFITKAAQGMPRWR